MGFGVWCPFSLCGFFFYGPLFCYPPTAAGRARYDECAYRPGDVVVFGCEARGLPAEVLGEFDDDRRLAIPMRPDNRSLNIANAVAIVTYEAWRQHGFEGSARGAHDGGGTFSETPRSDTSA